MDSRCVSCDRPLPRFGAVTTLGGPFDGGRLSAVAARHRVFTRASEPASTLWQGDDAFCRAVQAGAIPGAGSGPERAAADGMLRSTAGLYVVAPDDSTDGLFVPLWGASEHSMQYRLQDLAQFLCYYALQSVSTTHSSERHNLGLASEVALALPDDEFIWHATGRYEAVGLKKVLDDESP